MSSNNHPASAVPSAAPDQPVERLRACLRQVAHFLPAQAPLRDFVHHNTLHAFQHLPFGEALEAAARLTGARPWLDEARCRELFRQGRIDAGDLAVALRQVRAARADEVLVSTAVHDLRRGEVLQAALLCPPVAISPVALRWQFEERAAGERLQPGGDPLLRQRLLASAAAAGRDEAAIVADLWAAACALCGPPAAAMPDLDGMGPDAVADLWQQMLDRIGDEWTPGQLLAHLTGEDRCQTLQTNLIRHLAAHLDQDLAAWKNPAQHRGFYAAWRQSAGSDWSWELDEFAGTRQDLAQLPDDPLQAILGELLRLGIAEARWCGYLQRLALDLPGWAGMFYWRQAHPRAADPPVSLTDFLAVRVVLERLYSEQLVRRIWGLPLNLPELGRHLIGRPAELRLRHAFGCRRLPEDLLLALQPQLGMAADDADAGWARCAAMLTEWRATDRGGASAAGARAAWPLFVLAQHLGLSGGELRALGENGAQALLACADSLTAGQRGEVWLLAYERHYRQQILAALTANHGRAPDLSGRVAAQFVFCMDDREEGSRRHLEEVNPAFETFGAAGFFGVPMLWQGLDDEAPGALCPIVVRPTNTIRERVAADAAVAYERHQRRRRWRLRWQERLHQGSRRGWLSATLLGVGAAPLVLLGLLGRTLAPGRVGALLAGWRAAFDLPLRGALQLSASAGEAGRAASADAPRLGFSEDEQVTLVAGFLRSIGLTEGFAPLVVIVGHGSDSRNNPHLAAYDCGACSGRHGGPNARVLAALANRAVVRQGLAAQQIVIADQTQFIAAEHNTCDETYLWYDVEQLPHGHRAAFAALRRDCEAAAALHAVERCRRFASAPRDPTPQQALQHLAERRQDMAQTRPELGHATVAAAFVGRRRMSRGAFFDRRVFLISYDPLPDSEGRVLEATLLAAGPVGAGINLEYYFSTVNNEGWGCGSKILHNLVGLFGVMQGASSDLRTGLPLQMVEIHEAMRLLVIVEQTLEIVSAIYQRQPPLQELIGHGWILLAAKHPVSGAIHLFDPASGWQPWSDEVAGKLQLPVVECSADWFSGCREPLPPALLVRPLGEP